MYRRCSSATSLTSRAPARSEVRRQEFVWPLAPRPAKNASMRGRDRGPLVLPSGDGWRCENDLDQSASAGRPVAEASGSDWTLSAAPDVTSSVRLMPSGPATTLALTNVRASSSSGSAASDAPSLRNRSVSVMSASDEGTLDRRHPQQWDEDGWGAWLRGDRLAHLEDGLLNLRRPLLDRSDYRVPPGVSGDARAQLPQRR